MVDFLKKFRRADTILEVIIALFIVAMGTTIATNLMVNAIRSNNYSKNNLVAMNLATEGLEAMRDIRDSNWLKFSFDRDRCWNMIPEKASGDSCTLGNLIAAGNYTIDLDPTTMKWGLHSVSGVLDGSTNPIPDSSSAYQLHYLDLASASGPNGVADHDLFSSVTTGFAPSDGITVSGDSPFYRMVQISYSGVSEDTAKSMAVRSLVVWQEANSVQQVELNTILTDYNRVKVSP